MGESDRTGDQSTLLLVLPMYNEQERVAESLDRLIDFIAARPSGSRLLFVDDGSTDRTVEVVQDHLARRGGDVASTLVRPHAGKGAAVRSGLLQAQTDVAAFCDIDLATPLDELGRIVDAASAGSCLAIGSRAVNGSQIERHEQRRREIAGKAFNLLVRTTLCPGITDTQCGAKAAPTAVWRSLLGHSREDGFAWDVEIIALAIRHAVAVQEVGIRWNHDERTRVRVVHDGVSMVMSVPRIWRHVRLAPPGVAGRVEEAAAPPGGGTGAAPPERPCVTPEPRSLSGRSDATVARPC